MRKPFNAPAASFQTKKHSFFLITVAILFSACTKPESTVTSDYKKYIDTTVSVYGPYAAVKLPITTGVKIANPLQKSLSAALNSIPEGAISVCKFKSGGMMESKEYFLGLCP